MQLNPETAYTLPPETHQSQVVEITDAELTELITAIEPADQGNRLSSHLDRHLGENSTYAAKKALRESLKIIKDHFFHPSCSESMKVSIKFKLIERAEHCTPGFHDGVNGLIHSFYVPDNMDALLYLYRHDIVEKTAIQATNEVHTNNRFFTRAAYLKYGIRPLNLTDVYHGGLDDRAIDAELSSSFKEKMRFFSFMLGLEQQILNQVTLNGYKGQSTQFYGDFKEKTDGFFKKIFDTDACVIRLVAAEEHFENKIHHDTSALAVAQEKFNNLFYILDSEGEIIQDINWNNIRSLLWQVIQIKQYYKFDDDVRLAITTFIDPTTDLQAKKTSLLRIPGLNVFDGLIIHAANNDRTPLSWVTETEFAEKLLLDPDPKNTTIALRDYLGLNALNYAYIYERSPNNYAKKNTKYSLFERLLFKIATLSPEEQAECLLRLDFDRYPNVLFFATKNMPELLNALLNIVAKNRDVSTLLNTANHNEEPLLLLIMKDGSLTPAAQRIIELGVDVNVKNRMGETPLIYAAYYGNTKLVKLLLEKKVNINSAGGHGGETPLIWATKCRYADTFELLINRDIEITQRDWAGFNALDYAIKNNSEEMIKPLLSKIAILSSDKQAECLSNLDGGKYPNVLFFATEKKPKLLAPLLNTAVDVNAKNLMGQTPLILAAKCGCADAFTLLCNRDDITITHRDEDGFNALDYAIKNNSEEMLKPLLSKIATLSPDEQAECLEKVPGGPYPNIFFYAASLDDTQVLKSLVNRPTSNVPDSNPLELSLEPIYSHIHEMTEHYLLMQEKSSSRQKNNDEALETAKTLLQTCFDELKKLHSDRNIDAFKANCKTAIDTARPVLSQHRSWCKLLFKLFLAVITFPISLPFYMAGFFSVKTKSEQQLIALNEKLNKVNTKSNPFLPE